MPNDLGDRVAGQNGNQMFRPNIPGLEDFFSGQGLPNWSDLNGGNAGQHLNEARDRAHADLLKAYVATFSPPAGQRVLEDLMNNSLRTSMRPPGGFKTIEETALHTAQRDGQNGMIVHIMNMIVSGQELGDAAPKKKKAKSTKSQQA